MEKQKPKVIIGALEGDGDAELLQGSMQNLGAEVEIFHGQGPLDCDDCTHILLLVREERLPYEEKLLSAEDRRVVVVCVGPCGTLQRLARFFQERRISLLVRSQPDERTYSPHVPHHLLIPPKLETSARDIARATLSGWR